MSAAQLAITIEQVQAEAPKSQSAQVPLLGPPAVPLTHVDVEAHQPQPLVLAHAPQLV